MTQNDLEKITTELNRQMVDEHVSVSKDKNPIFKERNNLNNDQLEYTIAQYSLFPKHIVSFLYAARDTARKHEWHDVDSELTRNMGEELGTETHGLTHYQMLINGIQETLGVDISIEKESPSTHQFVQGMNAIMDNRNPSYATGAAYALESSAVPELQIVVQLVGELAQRYDKKFSPTLKQFFTDHLEVWEIGHEDNLRKACMPYITDTAQSEQFSLGFRDVMKTMDTWWDGLYKESLSKNESL